ncbi:terminase large subunit domain-containing protein [Variovorax ginsengisoli]|uniref:Terminase family protein n=1 Tax=Variovorax ginsengisoli TaxID=363844 RepID=A0ABT8RZI5_9BURK|nr:terminase family protein [Variovorax ginsengisoli]MDN8612783.1 terminase family protein [Variovorax ginsengisoli]MDO1531953.1 terminase family protein [Variovorax ginsengisoli]
MELHLHPRQTEAFLSTATEILYGGAAGGGKSHLMRTAAIAWCTAIPGLQVYIFRRISDDLAKNHMEGPTGFPAMLSEWIEQGHAKINWSKNSIEFWNGAKIHLCHCQYEKDRFKYQGAEIHVLMIDELTHFTDVIYRYLRGRCRLGGLRVPAQYLGLFPRIVNGSNPGGVGHNWVKATFVDQAAPMVITQMAKEEGGMRRQYVPAKLADNPTLTETDPDYVDRLEGLGNPALVKAMRDGDWNIIAGGMFDDLWDQEKHVLKPFAIPASWRIDRAFDWGSSKPFSVGFWAESDGTDAIMADGTKRAFPRGTLFRIGEWYGWNGRPNEGLKMSDAGIADGIVTHQVDMGIQDRVKPGPADSSIFDETNGDSPAKIQERHKVRWEKADKSPGSRKRGWSLLRGRLQASAAARMEEPGIFVFESCRQFIRTMPVLPRSERDPDDIDTDAEDHIADEVRYRILAVKRITTVEPLRM